MLHRNLDEFLLCDIDENLLLQKKTIPTNIAIPHGQDTLLAALGFD